MEGTLPAPTPVELQGQGRGCSRGGRLGIKAELLWAESKWRDWLKVEETLRSSCGNSNSISGQRWQLLSYEHCLLPSRGFL